jgi:hypothetical protein
LFRILQVATTGVLTLKALTVRGGFSGSGNLGGGILNAGTLTLIKSAITRNSAAEVGGIANDQGTVIVRKCTISSNNSAHSAAGLENRGGTVLITTTTFAGNGGEGCCALSNFEGGYTTITDSAFIDNASNFAGGIFNGGTLEVTNTTFARNPAGGAGRGAAIDNSGTLLLINSTLADNSSSFIGRSALFSEMNATTIMQNTILARTTGFATDCSGTVISLGNNLIGDPTGCTITLRPSDLTGDPGLDTFTDNGRPGNGHFPLLPTSPAIDMGSDAVCPRTDQLGRRRIGPCDIGAIRFLDKDDRQHEEDPAAAAQ